MTFVLPPKSQVGYLDQSLDEGQKIILSDGEQISWTPPPERLVMPDMSQIKALRKYFGRKGGSTFPAWLYHKSTDEARIVKNANEAAELGVCYREATDEERARYGITALWDYREDSEWRSIPNKKHVKFDPSKPGTGKIYVMPAAHSAQSQNSLIESLVPAVAAAVAQSLKATTTAPATIDAAQWEAFLAFQAFQKTNEVVNEAADMMDDGREGWLEEAERLGVRVDKRWSTQKIKEAVAKAA